MSRDVVGELRAAYEAGTKGEWRTYSCDSYSPVYGGADDHRVADRPSPNIMWQADAALIVAMHRHLPAMLAVVEAAKTVAEWSDEVHSGNAVRYARLIIALQDSIAQLYGVSQSTWKCTNSTRCDNCGRSLSDHRDQIYCPTLAAQGKTP